MVYSPDITGNVVRYMQREVQIHSVVERHANDKATMKQASCWHRRKFYSWHNVKFLHGLH